MRTKYTVPTFIMKPEQLEQLSLIELRQEEKNIVELLKFMQHDIEIIQPMKKYRLRSHFRNIYVTVILLFLIITILALKFPSWTNILKSMVYFSFALIVTYLCLELLWQKRQLRSKLRLRNVEEYLIKIEIRIALKYTL